MDYLLNLDINPPQDFIKEFLLRTDASDEPMGADIGAQYSMTLKRTIPRSKTEFLAIVKAIRILPGLSATSQIQIDKE